MKARLIMIIACLIMIVSGLSAHALTIQYDGITTEYTGTIFELYVNEKKPELPLEPIIFNDRALVPVREVFENLGADVVYEDRTKSVNIMYYDNQVTLYIGKNVAYVNGKKFLIPDGVVPKLINKVGEPAKTMVPVRFISESLNIRVEADSKAIYIYNGDEEDKQPEVTPEVKPDVPENNNNNNNGTVQPDKENVIVPPQIPIEGNKVGLYELSHKSTDTEVIATVKTTKKAEKIETFTLKSPNRIVVDVYNSVLQIEEDAFEINKNGVSSIRTGHENGRTRFVFDVDELYGVDVNVSDSCIEIIINADSEDITVIPPVSTDNSEKLIVLDAGHGGSDPGAIGTLDGRKVNEKDLTLSIVKKAYEILKNRGYNVQLTRSKDVYPTLTARAKFANNSNAAIFVSVHINSATSKEATGTEVYYAPLNNDKSYGIKSSELAKALQNELVYNLGSKNRGVKSSNHLVTRTSLMPAALVEIGFISNENELSKMVSSDYQDKAAYAIADGIAAVIGKVSVPDAETRAELQKERDKDLAEWEKTR